MSLIHRLSRSKHIHDDVGDRFKEHLPAGRLLDFPAGDGVNSRTLQRAGYRVVAGDLFADKIEGDGLERVKADLTKRWPFDDESFDGVLFSEGIEHLDAQLFALQEMARVLKPDGIAIVTTPNLLNLGSRLNTMLTGHAHTHRGAVVSAAQYWDVGEDENEDVYFGHVFLINAFQLRFYLEHAGFEVLGVDTTRFSINSLLLAPVLYPAVWWSTRRFLAQRRSRLSPEAQHDYRRQMLSAPILFGKKLIMVARKLAPEERRRRRKSDES